MFKYKINKQKNRLLVRGFTVIEILIIIAIISIMVSVALVSMKSASDKAKVKSAQREVASAIRLAQSDALQGKTQNNLPAACGISPGLPTVYVFKFTSQTNYGIYYNCEDISDATKDKLAETYVLSSGAKLKTPPFANTRIRFSVPDAKVSRPVGTFTISNSSGSVSKNIVINTGGSVTEQN